MITPDGIRFFSKMRWRIALADCEIMAIYIHQTVPPNRVTGAV
jgi:hypothetical protein